MPFARAQARYELAAEDKSSAAFRSLKQSLLNTDKQVVGLRSSLSSLTGTIGGLIGAGGFVALIKQSLDAGDAIQKLAQKTGASTEFLSRMDYAAKLSGSSLQGVAKAVQMAQRAAVEAADGTKQYADAFEKLGIDAATFKELDAETQFLTLTEAMGKLTNASDRTAAAMDIMGRSGTEMLQVMAGGRQGLEGMWKEADKLGLTLDRVAADEMAAANDALTRISETLRGLGLTLATTFAGPIEQLAGWVQSAIGWLDSLTDAIGRVYFAFAELFGFVQGSRTVFGRQTVGQSVTQFANSAGLNSLLEETLARYAREDAARGSRAAGGEVASPGLYQLHQGERVVSNSQTFGNINIHTQGGWPMSPSETRRWVRAVLIPEIKAASR